MSSETSKPTYSFEVWVFFFPPFLPLGHLLYCKVGSPSARHKEGEEEEEAKFFWPIFCFSFLFSVFLI